MGESILSYVRLYIPFFKRPSKVKPRKYNHSIYILNRTNKAYISFILVLLFHRNNNGIPLITKFTDIKKNILKKEFLI